MGKKKNADFTKIKVKIGKKKPSNNVTKFNLKTAKVVLRGDAEDKAQIKKEDESYLSIEKSDLTETLKRIDGILVASLSQKRVIMQAQRLDLTQSIWPTYFRHRWVTPWDDVVTQHKTKMGPMEIWMLVILDNAANCIDKTVTEMMVDTTRLYYQLVGDTEEGMMHCKNTLEIAKRYLKSVPRGLKQLGIELLAILAQYCPFSFWYHARQRSSVFVLSTLEAMFSETKKTYEQVLTEDKYILFASVIIPSALDGRMAGSIVVGENWSHVDDMLKPPFQDLKYEDDDERVEWEIRRFTDSKDNWDESILKKQSSFDLEECLSNISTYMLEAGLKILPIDVGNEKYLEKMLRVVKVLGRCCLRANNNKNWSLFITGLMENYPYTYKEDLNAEQMIDNSEEEEEVILTKLSKKDKKLRRQRMDLKAKMKSLCQQTIKVKDVKTVLKLSEDLNLHIVALVHQCLLSEKVSLSENFLILWIQNLQNLLDDIDKSRNDFVQKWLLMAKQMFRLTFDKSCLSVMGVCHVLSLFCRDVFMTAHPLSKVRRLALATYVEYCEGALNLIPFQDPGNNSSLPLPSVDATFINSLVLSILQETNGPGTVGPETRHPTYVSSQVHVEVTFPRALYQLLLINYPGVADILLGMDSDTTGALKTILNSFRRLVNSCQYPAPQRSWNRFRLEQLKYIPSHYCWDYFSLDQVSRKDAPQKRLEPLCSSVATFMLK